MVVRVLGDDVYVATGVVTTVSGVELSSSGGTSHRCPVKPEMCHSVFVSLMLVNIPQQEEQQ